MKKGLKYFLGTLLVFLSGVVLYLLVALLLSLWQTSPEPVACEARAPLYLTTNDLHLNFVIPTELMAAETLADLEISESATYASFGWGDRGFYLQTPRWKDLRLGVAAKALFWKSETAMHVDYFNHKYRSWKELQLCPEQYQQLRRYVMASFQRKEDGSLVLIDFPGYNATDRFYKATGSYTAFYTCNNWVNEGLKKAEVPTAVWSPFDRGVLHHIGNGRITD